MTVHRPLFLGFGLAALVAAGASCRDAAAPRPAPPLLAPMAPAVAPPPEPEDGARGLIAPNALVSRGKHVVGKSPVYFAKAKNVVDGDHETSWDAGKPTADNPAWVAIDLGKGPTRVLFHWTAGGSFNYDETDYGSPGAYRIETSGNSTDGEDGDWKPVVSVPDVTTHGRAHSFDFAGQRWAKLVVTTAPAKSPNGVQIDEIEVHDVSTPGARDAWFFMGDSITAFAFGRPPAKELSFGERVHRAHPGHFPAVMGGGIGGHKSDEGASHIDEWLAQNPDAHFWGIQYGTNDAAGDESDTPRFRANLVKIVERARSAGRVPILATIPFAADGQHRNIPRYNEVIDELRRANQLPVGPDLYAWFLAHPEELRDGLHPDDKGIGSINRLWAEAVDPLYAR